MKLLAGQAEQTDHILDHMHGMLTTAQQAADYAWHGAATSLFALAITALLAAFVLWVAFKLGVLVRHAAEVRATLTKEKDEVTSHAEMIMRETEQAKKSAKEAIAAAEEVRSILMNGSEKKK